jgi:hypothetical protein
VRYEKKKQRVRKENRLSPLEKQTKRTKREKKLKVKMKTEL